ncbi:MAG: UvrD-helicase domain-containing protein, partial [Vicinamibacterales bacterium]|nr:UvrD-helicase domain-containing protein [Vicinamibacterales bacterium]
PVPDPGQLADAAARETIRTALDRNLLVEASAGSGKTYSLAQRMAAGIATGAYTVDGMAAVTFTRKAAAELRGRFLQALEARLRDEPDPVVQDRVAAALSGIERLFTGTIHAFCARLLRERPVEAGLAPGFTELDEVENDARRRAAWRDFIAQERASGSARLQRVTDAGLQPRDLDEAFKKVSLFEEVTFPAPAAACPDIADGWARVEALAAALRSLGPEPIPFDTGCDTRAKLRRTLWRLEHARRDRAPDLMDVLRLWQSKPDFRQMEWHPDPKEKKRRTQEAGRLIVEFQQAVVVPYLEKWLQYVYCEAMELLLAGRAFAREARLRDQTLNYEDLLQLAARLLRERADVRAAMRRRYGRLFVDEFQDTDPVQAEVIVLLTAAEDLGQAAGTLDWRTARLVPGALFVVGDPKQSIYRFRRADIEVYNQVTRLIVNNGGEVVQLTTSFRSRPELCAWTNLVFSGLHGFGAEATPQQPAFSPLSARPSAPGGAKATSPAIQVLTLPADMERKAVPGEEAARIARYVRAALDAGRPAGDFLILTRKTKHLAEYAAALEEVQVPVEVSGAGAFGDSADVVLLASLLRALADPDDSVSIVGVMRGPLFGVSDAALWDWRTAGGAFRLRWDATCTLPGLAGGGGARPGDAVRAALERLSEWYRLTREYPVPVALELMLEQSGFLAWVASGAPGGAPAGDLLQAVERARQVAERGGSPAELADALEAEIEAADTEARCLEPGRSDVVRVMNLHKAKGLEARVVFLADAPHGVKARVDLRVDRTAGTPQGSLKIVRPKKDESQKRTPDVLGLPVSWEAHERIELAFLDAEEVRLRYVAATRAKELLVVCRWEGEDQWTLKPWGAFEPYLDGAPEVVIPRDAAAPDSGDADLRKAARVAAAAARGTRLERARRASWSVVSVGERVKKEDGRPQRDEIPASEAVASGEAGASPSGAAWGTLLHGLLEHAMRHQASTRDDLARLARWLTVEHDDLRPFIGEALDWVDAVRQLPFWAEARAAGQDCLVEVPFAVRLDGPAGGTPTVLRGVIDLIYRTDAGWRLVDYKSDRLDGVADIGAELRARHGAQLAEYADAWQRATGQRVISRDVVALRR